MRGGCLSFKVMKHEVPQQWFELMCRLVGEIDIPHLDQPVQMVALDYDDGPLFGARVAATALA